MSLCTTYDDFAAQRNADRSAQTVLKLLCQCLEKLQTGQSVTVKSLLKFTKGRARKRGNICNNMVARSNNEEMLIKILQNYPCLFKVTREMRSQQDMWIVQPHTDVGVCETWLENNDSCPGKCGDLHVCRVYLLGKNDCFHDSSLSETHHNLGTQHNVSTLRENLLDSLSKKHLEVFFSKALGPMTPSETVFMKDVPMLCFRYNGRSGCDRDERCRFLHLCKGFIFGNCKYGIRCKRCHDITQSQPKALLCKFSLEPDKTEISVLLEILKRKIQVVEDESARFSGRQRFKNPRSPESTIPSGGRCGQGPKTEENDVEFCPYDLKETCEFGDSCCRFHPPSRLPYQWQIQMGKSDGLKFDDITGSDPNTYWETAYCDPNNSKKDFVIEDVEFAADFETMTVSIGEDNRRLRRLSVGLTLGVDGEQDCLATEWRWYWKDDSDTWHPFDHQRKKIPSSVTSGDLESRFLATPHGEIEIADKNVAVDFREMKMRALDNHFLSVLSLRRRPLLLKPESMQRRIECEHNGLLRMAKRNNWVPRTWQPSHSMNYAKVPVKKKGSLPGELLEVESFVQEGLEGGKLQMYRVKTIYRIQNLKQLVTFESTKESMIKGTGCEEATVERRLFFVPKSCQVDGICQQGFGLLDNGLSSEFASEEGCCFSVNIARQKKKHLEGVFVARVLTGYFTNWTPNNINPCLNSFVDDETHPTKFFIFDIAGAYPEYYVQLESCPGETQVNCR